MDYIYCPCCGQFKARSNFYSSNKTKSGINHVGCKSCLLESATTLIDKKTGERKDDKSKAIATLRKLDLPYLDDVYESQLNALADSVNEKLRGTAWATYITMIASLPQYRNLDFSASSFAVDDLENNTEENIKIVQKTIREAKKIFGSGYTDEELQYLGDELKDWKTRYECNTKAQEEVFENLALVKLLKKKALLEGKPTDKLDKQQQDWLDSGGLKPKQNSTDTLSDAQTFGTLIQKYEETRPLPEIDPELEDVDKIGLYITTFYTGHMSKMLGLKNRFSYIYEKFIKKYTVTKPQYDEDDDSEDIFDKVFGSIEED